MEAIKQADKGRGGVQMNEKLTHWRSVKPSPYLAAVDLDGKDMIVTIECVHVGEVEGEKGRKDDCRIATLSHNGKDMDKQLLLNVTNCKALAKLTGSNYLESWNKQRVTLYVTPTKLKGETVDGIRIRLTRPPGPVVAPPKFSPEQKAEAGRIATEILELGGEAQLKAIRDKTELTASETIDALNALVAELKAKV